MLTLPGPASTPVSEQRAQRLNGAEAGVAGGRRRGNAASVSLPCLAPASDGAHSRGDGGGDCVEEGDGDGESDWAPAPRCCQRCAPPCSRSPGHRAVYLASWRPLAERRSRRVRAICWRTLAPLMVEPPPGHPNLRWTAQDGAATGGGL